MVVNILLRLMFSLIRRMKTFRHLSNSKCKLVIQPQVLPFASKTLPPFRDGTVAMSNGSSTVTGTNTNFLDLE